MIEFKTEKDIDDLEKHIEDGGSGLSAVEALSDKAVENLTNYLNDGFYDDVKEFENNRKFCFKVGEFKKLLENIPDDSIITFCEKNEQELLNVLTKQTTVISKHLNLIDLSIIHNGQIVVISKRKTKLSDVNEEGEEE